MSLPWASAARPTARTRTSARSPSPAGAPAESRPCPPSSRASAPVSSATAPPRARASGTRRGRRGRRAQGSARACRGPAHPPRAFPRGGARPWETMSGSGLPRAPLDAVLDLLGRMRLSKLLRRRRTRGTRGNRGAGSGGSTSPNRRRSRAARRMETGGRRCSGVSAGDERRDREDAERGGWVRRREHDERRASPPWQSFRQSNAASAPAAGPARPSSRTPSASRPPACPGRSDQPFPRGSNTTTRK